MGLKARLDASFEGMTDAAREYLVDIAEDMCVKAPRRIIAASDFVAAPIGVLPGVSGSNEDCVAP
jgi:hypothetical protein